jgi:transcription antitermination factor NusA-like protein
MEVVVEDKQLSLAIGKKGQNVRLAAKLTGWRIDIKSEEEKRREVEAQFAGLDAGLAEAGEAAEGEPVEISDGAGESEDVVSAVESNAVESDAVESDAVENDATEGERVADRADVDAADTGESETPRSDGV